MEFESFPLFSGVVILNILTMFAFFMCFSRISMRPIERKLKEEGMEFFPWDGVGFKTIWFANVIAFRGTILSGKNNPLVDTDAVNRLATKQDRFLAMGFCVSVTSLILMAIYSKFFN